MWRYVAFKCCDRLGEASAGSQLTLTSVIKQTDQDRGSCMSACTPAVNGYFFKNLLISNIKDFTVNSRTNFSNKQIKFNFFLLAVALRVSKIPETKVRKQKCHK